METTAWNVQENSRTSWIVFECLQRNSSLAIVGFFASLQPNQNAYTKVALSRTAEFRPYVNTCRVQVGWEYLYPQPLLHNDLNAPTYPEYSILGRRSFYRLECTNCLLYPIRAQDSIPKVLCNLRICAGPSRALLIL